jgi:hypothetical protein
MDDFPQRQPITLAVSLALQETRDPRVRSDLLFLEAWEMHRPANLAATLRASQIRRANPDLVEAIERELKSAKHRRNGESPTSPGLQFLQP